jgi:putative tricarboxylic transport membrane protein
MSYLIGLGEASSPGSGFIPFLTGCLLILLSTINLINIFFIRQNSIREKGFWEGIKWDKMVLVVMALFAYLLLLPILGYLVVTFFFLVFLQKLLEPQKWRAILIISTLSVAISYVVFGHWLKVQFPIGYLIPPGIF